MFYSKNTDFTLEEIKKTNKELNDLIGLIKTNEMSSENKRILILIDYTAKRLNKEVSRGIIFNACFSGLNSQSVTPSTSWIEIKRNNKTCRVNGNDLIDCRNKIKDKYPDWKELYNSECS